MPSISNLVHKLTQVYPNIAFAQEEYFAWNPEKKCVFYIPDGEPQQLLHELGHALLGHETYSRDIELLSKERAAWEKAIELANTYEVTIEPSLVELQLDTYRDWLHSRSVCPNCDANGVQTDVQHYQCLSCNDKWRVNDARRCALRRYHN